MVVCRPSLIGTELLTVSELKLMADNRPPLITPAFGVPATYRFVVSKVPTVAPPGTGTLAPKVAALPVPMFTTFTPAVAPPHSGPQFNTYALVSSLVNTALKG